jgi:hypothetical protein
MTQVADITAVSISLQVDGLQTLLLKLDQQGSLSRLGTGEIDNQEHDLLSGTASPELFRQTIKQLTDPMLDHLGSYDIADKEGLHCQLNIGFQYADGMENGFAFHYGSESEGPPQELVAFVAAAVQITEPWYERAKGKQAKVEE